MRSLAVLYRPNTFEDIVGQGSIIEILKRQLATNNIKNSYLFCGPSGTGKTTIARALALYINSNKGTPIEIDAASNNSVDNIRALVEEAQSRALDAEYKIFIIDECHTLSSQAWQALLKTLEEPPTYTIFMFCTTNPEKVPNTIMNRVMRFNLTLIPASLTYQRLCYICEQEGFTNFEETCDYLSRVCGGGLRDAIAALEKVADYSTDLSIDNALQVLGSYSYQDMISLTNYLVDNREADVLGSLDRFIASGRGLRNFVSQYLSFLLEANKYALCKSLSVTYFPKSLENDIKYMVSFERSIDFFNIVIDNLLTLKNTIRYDDDCNLTVEAAFVHILLETSKLWAA